MRIVLGHPAVQQLNDLRSKPDPETEKLRTMGEWCDASSSEQAMPRIRN